MSYDHFFMFDDPFYQHSTPTPIVNSDEPQLLSESDPFSSIDTILQDMAITEAQNTSSLNQIAHTLLSDSPPTIQQTRFSTGYPVSAIKTDEDPCLFSQSYLLGSLQRYGGCEAMFQRSYSHGSHSYEGEKPWFAFQPRFDALFESSDFLCSPQNGFSSAQIRRVCSTGDLPKVKNSQASGQGESSATILMEEANFKVGRYSADERKERIDRYRAKRNQRNFNKTIKYACRKTLADSRPRVRGRFARNDEPGEIPKSAPCSNRYEDEDDILVYNWQEEEDVEIVGCGSSSGDNAGGCGGGGGGGGQYMNYQFGASSKLHQYFGY